VELKTPYQSDIKTGKNAVVDAIDFQIPVTKLSVLGALKECKGKLRYTSRKASVSKTAHFMWLERFNEWLEFNNFWLVVGH